MFSTSRKWTGFGVVMVAALMLVGVALTKESPLFALSALAPFVLTALGFFVCALVLGHRWALASLLVAAILIFSVDLRGEKVRPAQFGDQKIQVEEIQPVKAQDEIDATSGLKFAVFLLALIAGAGALRVIEKRAIEMPAILLILYFVWAFVTAALSASPLYTFGATIGLAAWILFALAANERMSQRDIMLLVIYTCGAFCIGSLVAYYLFPAYGSYYSLGVSRLTGLSSTTNQAGQIAVICLIVIYAFHLTGARRATPWGLWACALAAVAVLLLSDTRAALVAGVIAAVALLVRQLRVARGTILTGVLLLALAAMAIAATPATTKFIGELASGVSRSGDTSEIWHLAGRAHLWPFVIDRIAENPIKGYGYGAGADVIRDNYRTLWGETTGSAHNAFLQSALDLGLVGVALIIGVFVWSLRQFFRRPSPFRDGVFLVVLVTCFFESSIAKAASPITLLWILSLLAKSEDAEASTEQTAVGAERA